MRRRMERASRQPPPPRRAADAVPGTAPPPAVPQARARAGRSARREPGPSRRHRCPPRRGRTTASSRIRLSADLPPVNLAIRVRKPLDDRLADVIHQLRRDGVRTSKVELIEMLLWEMPDDQLSAVRERLRQFRDWAPRGTGAPLEAEGG